MGEILRTTEITSDVAVSLKEKWLALRNTSSSASHPCLHETRVHRNKFVSWTFPKIAQAKSISPSWIST